jgi:hypothetical protein
MITTRIVFLGVLLSIWMSAAATASVWTFEQTGSSLPGLTVAAEVDIAGTGTFANLPTRSSFDCNSFSCPPPDLFPLVGLTSSGQSGGSLFLGNFIYPDLTHLFTPIWDVGPGGIDFISINSHVEFQLRFNPGSVYVADEGSAACYIANVCRVTGTWVTSSVPEPSSGWLLAVALLGLLILARHTRGAHHGGMRYLGIYA